MPRPPGTRNSAKPEIRKAYGLRVGAAERLQTQMETADPEQKERSRASLEKLVGELEKMVPEVEREEGEAVEAKTYYDELNGAVKTAAERLKTARARLTEAKRRMDTAKSGLNGPNSRKNAPRPLAGITQHGRQSLARPFDAMTKRAENSKPDQGPPGDTTTSSPRPRKKTIR